MRIAILTSHWNPLLLAEGIARVVHELRKIWLAQGHTVHIYAYKADHNPEQGVHKIPIPPIPLTTVWMNAWLAIARTISRYDIIFPQSALQCLFLEKKRCVPMIHTLSNVEQKVVWRFWRYAYGFLEGAGMRNVPMCITLSDDTIESLRGRYGVDPRSIVKVANGVDHETFRPDPAKRSANFTVLSAGRFVPRKRFDLLIRSYALFAAACPESRLIIAGGGPLETELKRLSTDLGIADRIEFAGVVDTGKMVKLYQASTVFALASEAEGMPLVVLEAQSCGLPAIVAGFSSAGEVIEDGHTGFIVGENRPEKWAAALASIYRDSEQRVEMGRRARDRIVARFGWDGVAATIMSVFQQVQNARH